jgi:hypothetical protein
MADPWRGSRWSDNRNSTHDLVNEILVGILLWVIPPDGPGLALMSASGSYLG